MELGIVPSKPVFDTRYDIILDESGILKKAQVKYANGTPSKSTGAVVVKLAYENRKKKVVTYARHEVDCLIVYIPKIDKLCMMPPETFIGKRNLNIRLNKPGNNQKKGVLFAEDYFW